jgi:serine/threonine-protein kinase SRPK3
MHQYLAVKILTAHATQVQNRVADEIGILQLISERAQTTIHPGRNHVVTLLDSFELVSAHGRHLCLVHEAMGSFTDLFQPGRKLPVPVVKDVTKQLLQALDFLHGQCRVIHTGIVKSFCYCAVSNRQ